MSNYEKLFNKRSTNSIAIIGSSYSYQFLPHSLTFRFLVWAPNSMFRRQKVISEEKLCPHFLLVCQIDGFSLFILSQLNASQGHHLCKCLLISCKLIVSWAMWIICVSLHISLNKSDVSEALGSISSNKRNK